MRRIYSTLGFNWFFFVSAPLGLSDCAKAVSTPTPGPHGQDAATVPTVFMTVEAALLGIASLGQEPGAAVPGVARRRVLLHAAAGGVGLSGLQVGS